MKAPARGVLTALLLLLAAPVFAQITSDLRVDLSASTKNVWYVRQVPVGQEVIFTAFYSWYQGAVPQNVVLEINVPGAVTTIVPKATGVSCTAGQPIRCTIVPRSPNDSGAVAVTTAFASPGEVTATAKISSTPPDANPDNNTDEQKLEILSTPDFRPNNAYSSYRIDPSSNAWVYFSFLNEGATATNVVLRITLPEGGTFTKAPEGCTLTPLEVVCRRDTMTFFTFFDATVEFISPDKLAGGPLPARAVITSDEPDRAPGDNAFDFVMTMVRHILVTNVNDEGTGSLRQALLDAAVLCADAKLCTVDFRIPGPVPEGGWFTIRPRSALPDVRGFVKIDGATQTAFGGDTNPDGPEIEINGSLAAHANGLNLTDGCEMQVLDLAINGFSGPGIELRRAEPARQTCAFAIYPSTLIARNYLGTDARGRAAVPNDRGLTLASGFSVSITDNVISGNRRAGLFIDEGAFVYIYENRIGVSADDKPLGNGASGIFFDMSPGYYSYGGGADVVENVIAYNGHWGVARTRNGDIAILENSIFGNTFQGIDVDLDFETPNRGDDSRGVPNKPVLFSAAYDPATGNTIVRGRLDSNPISGFGQQFRIDVYASSSLSEWGQAQGETWLATKSLDNANTDFEIVLTGDLRGKFITATNSRRRAVGWAKPPGTQSHQSSLPTDTSEFSNVVEAR